MAKYDYIDRLVEDLRSSKDNFLDTKLGITLKIELKKLNHWKDKPRGDASKGHQAMIDKINSNN